MDLQDAVQKIETPEDVVAAKADEILAEETLIANTQKRLEVLTDDGVVDEDEPKVESTPVKQAEETKVVDDSTPVKTDEQADDSVKKEEAKEEDADKDEAKQLPDAYYRAAIHRGWTGEEVNDFFKTNPELCLRTLAKVYGEVNQASKDFAFLGRAKKEQTAPAKTEVAAKPVETVKPAIDVEALRRQYPDDPIVDMVAALSEQNSRLMKEVEKVGPALQPSESAQPALDAARQAQADAICKQIEGFFSDADMKQYEDFYGKLPSANAQWNTLMPGQHANRWAVVEMMDHIITGAKEHGREINMGDALRMAHLSISEPIREKVIRETIKQDVEKRNKNITLRPSGSTLGVDEKTNTSEGLVSATEKRLRNVFGGR